MTVITLGSLFDGSGGFPLAGVLNGIVPMWSSEIEPYPLRVTAARFPEVLQLGDVTKIDGAKIEPVDVITFGSPCQDLSIAGKMTGIHDGKRSNLFFEAVRIIKEMREAHGGTDQPVRPRFAVWENVPGAFSSNRGGDFRAVLEALAAVAGNKISIPRPARGRWDNAGCVVGDGWSIAWRTYDAQYWGVPQRRRRIYLVADFGSERAGEILFERESVCGNHTQGGPERETAPADAARSPGRGGRARSITPAVYPELARSLCARGDSSPCIDRGMNVVCVQNTGQGWWNQSEIAQTLRTPCGGESTKANLVVYDARGNGDGTTAPTLTGDHSRRVSDYTALCNGNGQLNQMSMTDKANTLDCMHDQQAVLTDGKPPRIYIVRRLTPLECCRLQGFPGWWEDGVEGSDTARYKMWGNGIALPCAADVLRRIVKEIRRGDNNVDR